MFTSKQRLDNLNQYQVQIEYINKFIKETDFKSYSSGEKIVLTDDIYFFKSQYRPKEQSTNSLENHKQMIDIHYAYQGDETIAVGPIDNLVLNVDYNVEKDVEWYHVIDPLTIETKVISEGQSIILFPGEAHEPEIKASTNDNIKIVFKIKYQ